MTTTSDRELWHPFEDEPLIVPEFALGWQVLSEERPQVAHRLTDYLTALVQHREVVHVAIAFNAIYFGYSLDFGGYSGGPIDFDEFPVVHFGETTDALPVGAMVNVATGSSPLAAEVVYKEGAHQMLGDLGIIPDWLSGAPAGATGPGQAGEQDASPALAERLVIDVNAFGIETVISEQKFARLRRHHRWVDPAGHLLLQARYPKADDAEADDLEFYLRYLLGGPGRTMLLGGPLPMLLTDEAGEPELEAALRGCMGTVADALADMESLRMWREYAVSRASVRARLADQGVLGGGDLRSVVTTVAGPPAARKYQTRQQRIGYTAVGPLLRSYAGDGQQLTGLRYPATVCHANLAIASYATHDVDDGGLLPSGAHLRLDDPWQGGGVWRVSLPGGPYARADPLVPYGLGWLSSLPSSDDGTPLLADGDGSHGLLLSVKDSHLSWTVPLRLRDTLAGTVAVPDRVVEELEACGLGAATLRLVLHHDGFDLDEDLQTQPVRLQSGEDGGPGRFGGATWPLDFFVGIMLTFTWQVGAVLMHAQTTLLDTPVVIDGEEYDHRFDPGVLTRDTAPGCVNRGQRQRGALSLQERVLRAVRRVGLLSADGVAALPRELLPVGVYGADVGAGAAAALEPVVQHLLTTGVLSIGTGRRTPGGLVVWPIPGELAGLGAEVEMLVWQPKPPVPIPRQRSPEPAVPDAMEALRRYLSKYEVAAFPRRLPAGQQASPEKYELFRRLRARWGLSGELPDGWTVVIGHERSRWW